MTDTPQEIMARAIFSNGYHEQDKTEEQFTKDKLEYVEMWRDSTSMAQAAISALKEAGMVIVPEKGLRRPFSKDDRGPYYLIEGSIREDFTIHAQRKTVEELDDSARTIKADGQKHHFSFLKGVSVFPAIQQGKQ